MTLLITVSRFPPPKPLLLVLLLLSILLNGSRVAHVAVRFRLYTYGIVFEVPICPNASIKVDSVVLEVLRGIIAWGTRWSVERREYGRGATHLPNVRRQICSSVAEHQKS